MDNKEKNIEQEDDMNTETEALFRIDAPLVHDIVKIFDQCRAIENRGPLSDSDVSALSGTDRTSLRRAANHEQTLFVHSSNITTIIEQFRDISTMMARYDVAPEIMSNIQRIQKRLSASIPAQKAAQVKTRRTIVSDLNGRQVIFPAAFGHGRKPALV